MPHTQATSRSFQPGFRHRPSGDERQGPGEAGARDHAVAEAPRSRNRQPLAQGPLSEGWADAETPGCWAARPPWRLPQLSGGKNTAGERPCPSSWWVAVLRGQHSRNTFGDHPQTAVNAASQPVVADSCAEARPLPSRALWPQRVPGLMDAVCFSVMTCGKPG